MRYSIRDDINPQDDRRGGLHDFFVESIMKGIKRPKSIDDLYIVKKGRKITGYVFMNKNVKFDPTVILENTGGMFWLYLILEDMVDRYTYRDDQYESLDDRSREREIKLMAATYHLAECVRSMQEVAGLD